MSLPTQKSLYINSNISSVQATALKLTSAHLATVQKALRQKIGAFNLATSPSGPEPRPHKQKGKSIW
jgi:hypothetical protein